MQANRSPQIEDQKLIEDVRDALDNIEGAIVDYIYENKRAAYKTVATNLRTLLADDASAQSFVPKTKRNLFELCWGPGTKIHVQSFDVKAPSDLSYIVPPALYRYPTDIVWYASQDSHLVSLSQWLSEYPITNHPEAKAAGNVGDTLRWIASNSGAHAFNKNNDPRHDMVVALPTDDEIAKLGSQGVLDKYYGLNWEQFVVDAGMRLLSARVNRRGQMVRLFDHGVPIPTEPVMYPYRVMVKAEKKG